ncbi:TPA: hypothetical protein ACN359_002085 [Vibrio parahaemolyticus]
MNEQLELVCVGSYRLRYWFGKPAAVTVGKTYNLFKPKGTKYRNELPYFLDDEMTPRSVQYGEWAEAKEQPATSLKEVDVLVKHFGGVYMQQNERLQEQPAPTEGKACVVPEVMKDLTDRLAKGVQTYGKPLQTHNGRDALQDAYEEVLDLACYLKQLMMERDQ